MSYEVCFVLLFSNLVNGFFLSTSTEATVVVMAVAVTTTCTRLSIICTRITVVEQKNQPARCDIIGDEFFFHISCGDMLNLISSTNVALSFRLL